MPVRLSALLLIATLAAGALIAPAPSAAAAPADDVAAATEAWATAYNSHDPAHVLARYASDAVFWGTTSMVLRETPGQIAEYFAGLSGRPSARVRIGEHRVRVMGNVAIDSGVYIFTEVVDGEPVTRPSRFSFVYRLDGGEWRIVDHHSSRLPAP